MITKFFLTQACKVLTGDSQICYQFGYFGSSSLNPTDDLEIIREFRQKHELDTFLRTKGIDPERFYAEMERYMRSNQFMIEENLIYCKDKPCWQQGYTLCFTATGAALAFPRVKN